MIDKIFVMQGLMRTHLYEYHRRHGRLVEYAGFEMPVWYEGVIPEHMAVRRAVGMFDTTHMGRAVVEGGEAAEFLDYVATNDIRGMEPMQARYTVMCNERGGVVDDMVVYRLEEGRFLVVYNAVNRRKDFEWLRRHSERFDVEVRDVSDTVVMLAVQGPKAEETLQRISSEDLSRDSVGRFRCLWTELASFRVLVSRTGYTGEDGFEVFLWDEPLERPERALKLWSSILEAGRELGIKPCGLGARDTLRLEAGMCLYGNELTEDINPLEAGLRFVVKLGKGDFIGRDALLRMREEGVRRRRVGLMMLGRGIPRSGYKVYREGVEVGYVTSGTYSPLFRRGIAMAYLSRDVKRGQTVQVDIRGEFHDAEVVSYRFLRMMKR